MIKKIIFGVLALILSACSYNSSYKTAEEEALKIALSNDYLISPSEAEKLADESSALFIDLRSPAQFTRGHIDAAVNLPTHNLLEPESKKILKDKTKTIILYGDSELEANGPWMLLMQLGYQNIKVLQGGYSYWSDLEADGNYLTETALFPYDSLFVLATQRTQLEEEALRPKPVVVRQAPSPQKNIVPQKKKVEKEEEEGC